MSRRACGSAALRLCGLRVPWQLCGFAACAFHGSFAALRLARPMAALRLCGFAACAFHGSFAALRLCGLRVPWRLCGFAALRLERSMAALRLCGFDAFQGARVYPNPRAMTSLSLDLFWGPQGQHTPMLKGKGRDRINIAVGGRLI